MVLQGKLRAVAWSGAQEYFAQTVGWPITLIASGGVMIALGIVAVKINNTYIAQK